MLILGMIGRRVGVFGLGRWNSSGADTAAVSGYVMRCSAVGAAGGREYICALNRFVVVEGGGEERSSTSDATVMRRFNSTFNVQ